MSAVDGCCPDESGSPEGESMEDRPELIRQLEIITHTGSRYRVGRDADDRWWMRGANVPNPRSVRLSKDRWWRIRSPTPWPPELGERIRLMAPDDLEPGDPDRVPGGGKRTSPVRAVRCLEAGAHR